MRVVCVWCRREGRAGILRDQAPLDDPTESHGICAWHEREMLADLPAPSFPGVDLLLVVRPSETALYRHLRHACEGLAFVRVIVDRRLRDRRGARWPVRAERRSGERRVQRGEFYLMGYTAIRFGRPAG